MVTTKQKPRVDPQKIKRETEYTTRENNRSTKIGTEGTRNIRNRIQPERN